MNAGRNRHRHSPLVISLGIFALLLGWALSPQSTRDPGSDGADFESATIPQPDGSPQLVSYEQLPPDGEMCDLPAPPAGAGQGQAHLVAASLDEVLQQNESAQAQASTTAAPNASTAPATVDLSKREPVRMIHDPYSAFSSIAVDDANNDVIMTDENLFNILTYDRTANTPRTGVTEPKRKIGGLNTNIEFQCGLYVDQKSGDIYAVNNDTVDRLVIFSRKANGDVPPDRQIHTPHGTFGIAVDDVHQELMLTVQHDNAVVTFRKGASDEDAPIRLLQGDHTRLADPHGMALDTKDDLIFVTNHGSTHEVRPPTAGQSESKRKENWPLERTDAVPGSGRNLPPSITVYRRTASGDTPPLRVITGAKTTLDWPTGITYDEKTDEILVANDMGNSVLAFPASASGDAAPTRTLTGDETQISHPTGVYLDSKNNELWVANFGNHTATVYPPTAHGDTPPLRVIRSAPEDQPTLDIGNPHPVAYDSKREQILVPN